MEVFGELCGFFGLGGHKDVWSPRIAAESRNQCQLVPDGFLRESAAEISGPLACASCCLSVKTQGPHAISGHSHTCHSQSPLQLSSHIKDILINTD